MHRGSCDGENEKQTLEEKGRPSILFPLCGKQATYIKACGWQVLERITTQLSLKYGTLKKETWKKKLEEDIGKNPFMRGKEVVCILDKGGIMKETSSKMKSTRSEVGETRVPAPQKARASIFL